MTLPKRVRRLFTLRHRSERTADLVDLELRHHVEMRTRELVARGYSEEDAHRIANESLGDLDRYRALCVREAERHHRATRWSEAVSSLFGDVRYTLRGLAKAKGFSAAILLTLALGIGANAAIFTVVDAMLLRSIPYPEPDQLYELRSSYGGPSQSTPYLSPDVTRALREGDPDFGAPLHLHARLNVLYTGGTEPTMLTVEGLSVGAIEGLGMRPMLGRTFDESDVVPGATPVTVVSHGFWMDQLGGDPTAVGRTILFDEQAVTVVGVMPQNFRFPHSTGTPLWLPLATDGTVLARRAQPSVFLRLASISRESAQERAEAFARARHADQPDARAWELFLEPMNDRWISEEYGRALWVAFGAVCVMFLVALVNVVNLVLARMSTRAREIGVRLALGGSRARVAFQLAAESFALALVGSAVAAAAAKVGVDALLGMAPDELVYWAPRAVRVDGRVLAFTFALAVIASVAAGLGPALRAVRVSSFTDPRSSATHAGTDRESHRLRNGLVIAQVGGTLTLLFGAVLLGRSFSKIVRVDPGFEPAGLVDLWLTLPAARFPTPASREQQIDRIEGRLNALPGVTAVSRTAGLPPNAGISWDEEGLILEGRDEPIMGSNVDVSWTRGDAEFRSVLGIELLRGEDLTVRDGPDYNVLVTEALARRMGGPDEAIGARIRFGREGTVHHVVGVVENVKLHGPLSPYGDESIIYLLEDGPAFGSGSSFAIRTSSDPVAVLGAVRRAVETLDPNQPIEALRTVDDSLRDALARPRFFLVLMTVFSVVALALAAVGLYGLLSFVVGARRREIGVRVALGAGAAGIRALVLRSGLELAVVGVAIGLVIAVTASRALSPLLFETSPLDAWALAAAGGLLLGVAALASFLPALRATRVDPIEVLRDE